MLWRKARLSEPAIPLGPHRFFAFGKVETLDDRSPLPSIVSGIGWFIEDIPAGGYVSPPGTDLGHRLNVQELDGAR